MTPKIGLDGGHGLFTAGKQTPTGIKEWTLNDKVCDKIVAILKDYDCEVIRTDHNEGNIDETLAQRVNEYIKAGVKCFVSIHHDAFTGNWNSATGFSIFTDRNYTSDDERLAKIIQAKMLKYVKLRNRGIKRANFYVINQNKIPAILIEGGFMDGTNDYKIITSEEGQNNYARAVAEGLIEFCELKKKIIPIPSPTKIIKVTYQAHDDVKDKWLNNIVGVEGKGIMNYAGNLGHAIDALLIDVSEGDVYYKVHVKNTPKTKGRWLPEVKNRKDYAGNLGQPIDGVMIRCTKGTIHYQVHIKGGSWLGDITGYNASDSKYGYAGILGKEIDAIRIWFN